MKNMDYTLIEYKEEFGEINWQEGFENELKGKTIEEQLHCYGWSDDIRCTEPYTELEKITNESKYRKGSITPVQEQKLIVKDGLIAGIMLCLGRVDKPIMPYRGYCYDSASDNNGAGYKEREWYKYLICLPFEHKLF